MPIKALIPQENINRLFLILLALYCGLTITQTQIIWLQNLVSLPLIFFYPGYYVSKLWQSSLPGATRLSLSLVFSIAIHIALLSLFKTSLSLTTQTLSWYLIILNLLIAVVLLIFSKGNSQKDTLPYGKIDYIILSIPIALFFINFLLSPLVSEGDSYYFIYAAMDSFKAGHDVSPYINRPGFIPFIGLLKLAGSESYGFIFRFFLPLCFYISTFPIIDYVKKHSQNYNTSRWLFLLFLAAPILTTEVDIVRPQSLLFIFTVPVLILLGEYLVNRKISYLFIAFLITIVSTRIHELSYVLVLTCLCAFGLHGIRYLIQKQDRKKIWKQLLQIIGATIIIGYPYFQLLQYDSTFSFIRNSTRGIFQNLYFANWRWWFLSDYKVDGYQLGWSGSQAALYYLYNGILLLIAIAFLLWLTKKKIRWITLMPALIFTFIYFSVAEILPRFGLFYYPNRAWPHLIIGLVVLVITMTMNFRWRHPSFKPLIIIALGSAILAGVVGWTQLTLHKGGFFMREEIPIRDFIRDKLPDQSTLFVTQSSNQALVGIYSEQQSVAIPYLTTFSDPQTISEEVIEKTTIYKITKSETSPYLKRIIVQTQTGEIISEETHIIEPTTITIPEPIKIGNNAYFYYSFARFNGYMGQREWWRQVNSYQNYEFFQNFPDNDEVVYRDKAGIIIKLTNSSE